MPGQACKKLKRAVESAAEVLSEPDYEPTSEAEASQLSSCNEVGQPCHKAKRSAEALAEALAQAYAIAEPDPEPVPKPGKRYALAGLNRMV